MLGSLGAVRARASGSGSECALTRCPRLWKLSDGSVADVVEVRCESGYAGKTVRLNASQLYARCGHNLQLVSSPYPYAPVSGQSITVKVDNYGNAKVALWGGPGCATGASLLSVDQLEEPYFVYTNEFTVEEARPTTPGVSALPSTEIAGESGSMAMIIAMEFPPEFAGHVVNINAAQVHARCHTHDVWVEADGALLATSSDEVSGVTLDEQGNAFVVLAGESCAVGSSLVETSLESAPFTTYTTEFTIIPSLLVSPAAYGECVGSDDGLGDAERDG